MGEFLELGCLILMRGKVEIVLLAQKAPRIPYD